MDQPSQKYVDLAYTIIENRGQIDHESLTHRLQDEISRDIGWSQADTQKVIRELRTDGKVKVTLDREYSIK